MRAATALWDDNAEKVVINTLSSSMWVDGYPDHGIRFLAGLTIGNAYIDHSGHGRHRGPVLATTIQLNEKTRDELFKVVASLQSKLGRRVSFDEAIMMLIQETRDVSAARKDFEALFGSLRGDRDAWHVLESLRAKEARRLERIARSAR